MSNFFDKPKEIQLNAKIPRPPKGFLKEKEYIVFQKSLYQRPWGEVYYFISSFGRFFIKYHPRQVATEWVDISSPDVSKSYQIDIPPLCFINHGWCQLIEFLDNNSRLAPKICGGGGYDTSSDVARGLIQFIPKILALYVQSSPDAVITETNNDPDVFFRSKQMNPTLSKTFDELREQLQPSDEVIPEWRVQAKALSNQSVPGEGTKYDDFIKARKSLKKMIKGGKKKRTKKKSKRRKSKSKSKSRSKGK
tara:strand:+ start:130 stop:879 length:750 start_codon:yes stop_codon:yes gene_type:complete